MRAEGCAVVVCVLFVVVVFGGVGGGCRVLNEPHRFSIDLDLVENSAIPIPTIRSSTENSEMFVCLLTFLICKNPDVYIMLSEKFRVR